MRVVALSLLIGLAWAAMQWGRGAVEPVEAAAGVLIFLAFGFILWGVRSAAARLRAWRNDR